MAIRMVESFLPEGTTPSDFGQASAEVIGPEGERYVLISYLSSPVTTGTNVDYVVMVIPWEFDPTNENWGEEELNHENSIELEKYSWKVTKLSTPSVVVKELETEIGLFRWVAGDAGEQYKIEVVMTNPGQTLATLELIQDVIPHDLDLESEMAQMGKPNIFRDEGLRELIEDFRAYIVSAAGSTGAKGIPSSFLAAVLFMEILARPKEGSAQAHEYRYRHGGTEDPTWFQWMYDEGSHRVLGFKREFHMVGYIRCVELRLVGDVFDDRTTVQLDLEQMAGKSIGVGQIGLSTAAMALGVIPWLDFKGGHVDVGARATIEENWQNLSFIERVGHFNRLRFPKANIALAAKLLTMLKNRAHRWPELSPSDFKNNKKAVQIIATEYNKGSTDTPRDDAKPNGNGIRANKYIQDNGLICPRRYFP